MNRLAVHNGVANHNRIAVLNRMAVFTGLLALLLGINGSVAQADLDDWSDVRSRIESPEHFGLELRIGIYEPSLGDTFTSFFSNDVGPRLGMHLDYFPIRIPFLGLIGAGGGIGWSQWDSVSRAGAEAGAANTEERTVLEILPLEAVISLRFDTLAREFNIPLILTPRIGLDLINWSTGKGGIGQAGGWSIGPRFSGKLSLELDFLEPRAARQLDEEWGINHTELFFDAYYSMAGELSDAQLPIGGFGWAAGLGLTF